MTHKSKNHTTPRLYENNFLEALSRCPFWLPPIIYVPVIAYFQYEGYTSFPNDQLIVGVVLGIGGFAFWTFTEYMIHRFVFHYKPTSKAGKRFIFVVHGVHHDYPNDLYRLVFPISVSIPLAVLFYFLFTLIPWSHESYISIFFGSFILGYLCYDMLHFATHALAGKGGLFSVIKKHHMNHHFLESNSRFGISNGFWDVIFRSKGRKSIQ